MKKKTNLKFILRKMFFGLVFLIGLLVLLYPLISQMYYRVESSEQIVDFHDGVSEMNKEEIAEKLSLARAFNDSLNKPNLEDPYEKNRIEEGVAAYAKMLEVNEKIGVITIPKIGVELPVYAGTSETVLQKGAGHLEGTSLPVGGNSTHSVITAHTGLPEAKLFTDLTKLKVGDKFYIENIGGTLAYQTDEVQVIEPSDFSSLLVVPGHDYVTLLTCTPYMVNTHRLLVRGHRVPYVEAVDEVAIAEGKTNYLFQMLFIMACIIIVILLIIIYILRQKKAMTERKLRELKKARGKFNESKTE